MYNRFRFYASRPIIVCGEMSERSKEHDWKSCVLRTSTMGSNPILSAKKNLNRFYDLGFFIQTAWFGISSPFSVHFIKCFALVYHHGIAVHKKLRFDDIQRLWH